MTDLSVLKEHVLLLRLTVGNGEGAVSGKHSGNPEGLHGEVKACDENLTPTVL